MEGAEKDIPGADRAAKQKTIEKNVEEINKNFKENGVNVRFKLKKINWDVRYPEEVDPKDGLSDEELLKVMDQVKGELKHLKEFENGKGAKVTLVEKIEPNTNGVAIRGDTRSPIVKSGMANDTYKHELGHGLGLDDDPDKQNFMHGVKSDRIKTKVDEDQAVIIEMEAEKVGDSVKSESKSEIVFKPILISRSWELDITDDVFYFNGTLAIGYGYVDIAEVKSYSEEPFSTREFEIFVDGLFPENVSMIIPIRLYFDTDGNSFTGFYGYDKMLLINMTGFYPFTDPQSLEVIDPVTNATIYQEWVNVSVTRQSISVELELPAPPPPDYPANDHISFNLSSSVLSTLNFTATNINTLLLIEDQTATVMDNLTFTFSTLPEQLPTIEVTQHSAPPGTVIGLTGSGFTPLGNVSLYLDDLIIGTVQSNETGGIATNITIPNVLGGGYYFLTAIDPVNLDSAFTILIVIAHDISIPDVTPSKTIVGQGFSLNINVTLANQGNYTETFNVTAYANTTMIETKQVTLTSGTYFVPFTVTLTFTWKTTGFAKGNYIISAYALPVPGETDKADNNCTDGWVMVTWQGDLTDENHLTPPGGVPDMKVDENDLWYFCGAFIDYYKIPSRLDANCDFNNDGKMDEDDLWYFCAAFIDYYKAH